MIDSLRLQNYRSYKDDSFEFDKGVNIVVGPNASGKTNLLEGVLVLCRGNSYRAADVELVKFDKPWARLDGFFSHQQRILKLEKVDNSLVKTFQLDGKTYKRLPFEGTIPVVYFEPNHLQLITRGPQQRRDYFDELLERSLPGYKTNLSSYKRALSQRNNLLKKGPALAEKQMFAWNIRLSELGEKIVLGRSNLVDDINKEISKTYSRISKHKSSLVFGYDTQFAVSSYANKLLSKLEHNTDEDCRRGFTSFGPHRDDYSISLNNQPANTSASRGETRSIMLALKVYELDLVERVRSAKAIFLLDDVFSELDGARRQALVKYLDHRQTIITTTDADAVLEYFSGNHNTIAL